MSDLYKRVKNLEERVSKNEEGSFNTGNNSQVRGMIALIFTICYVGLLIITFFGTLIYNILASKYFEGLEQLTLKDTILLISGTLSGMYGLVLGYYFKSSN
ncbi:MAG: hypothetical protein WC459_02620 [Patescibacteria group bacterium]